MQDSLFSQYRNQFNSLLDNNQDFGIIVSSHQNMDNMAAALSLYLALTDSGKTAQVVSLSDAKVEVSNLVGIDKLKKSFDGVVKQFVISLPYRENEIEKISYNAEGSSLNINVIAGESGITFAEQDIKIQKTGSTPAVIFTIGIQTQEELHALVQPNENLKVINIDNSGVNAHYGDLVYVNPLFSSISEVAGKLIYDSGLVLEQDTAQNLMNGIVSSTNDFANTNTSSTAFETAGILLIRCLILGVLDIMLFSQLLLLVQEIYWVRG
jgi:nanoRNase/pAp phosphatase (c-di-AMP/oligoRNAs hydrolase)